MWNKKEEWDALPFKQKAYFYGGKDNLTVLVSNIPEGEKADAADGQLHARIIVYANGMPQITPSVAVVNKSKVNGNGNGNGSSGSTKNNLHLEVHEILRE